MPNLCMSRKTNYEYTDRTSKQVDIDSSTQGLSGVPHYTQCNKLGLRREGIILFK